MCPPQTPSPAGRLRPPGPAPPHFPVSSASGSSGTPNPGFSSMLYGMKIANLAFVTKTQVRFFKLDCWADASLPEKRKMKLGSDISTHHKSLLAKIYHDRCVRQAGAGACGKPPGWGKRFASGGGEDPSLRGAGGGGLGAGCSAGGVGPLSTAATWPASPA